MRALGLALALIAASAEADGNTCPRARCAACSLMPAGATGTDLTLSGDITAQHFKTSITGDTGVVFGLANLQAGLRFDSATNTLGFAASNGVVQWRVNGGTGNLESPAGIDRNATTAGNFQSSIASGFRSFDTVTEGARVGIGPDTNVEEQGTRIRARQGIDGTAGSGTGITANQTSAIAHQVHKLTVINTALTAAASTDITIWTTPVNTRILRITANVTQVFTGGALSAMTVQCGNAAGGTQYLLAGSVFTAQTTLGDVQAEIGAGLLSATYADMGVPAAGVPAAIAISCRFACTGANCSAATQGSVTFNIEHEVYP